eukprot:5397858-Pleurochrysis_carterae.AAC.5
MAGQPDGEFGPASIIRAGVACPVNEAREENGAALLGRPLLFGDVGDCEAWELAQQPLDVGQLALAHDGVALHRGDEAELGVDQRLQLLELKVLAVGVQQVGEKGIAAGGRTETKKLELRDSILVENNRRHEQKTTGGDNMSQECAAFLLAQMGSQLFAAS